MTLYRPALSVVALLLSSTGALPAQCTTAWKPGSGLPGIESDVFATTVWDPDGTGPLAPRIVFAGGIQRAGPLTACFGIVARDTATGAWSKLGTGFNSSVHALVVAPNGDLIAGGAFTTAGGIPAQGIARWNGTTWSAIGGSTNGTVLALAISNTGDLIAGGQFTTAGGVVCNHLARWDGSAWHSYGTGIAGPLPFPSFERVSSLLAEANGDLVIGGIFASVDGVTARNVALWNGSTWLPLGYTVSFVQSLTRLPNGFLAAAIGSGPVGTGGLAFWDGAWWIPTNAGFPTNQTAVLCAHPNGDLLATSVGAPIQRWDGTSWSVVAPAAIGGQVRTMLVAPNGDLIAAGNFDGFPGTTATGAAIWNGALWSALASGCDGVISRMAQAPNGDVFVSGSFSQIDATPASRLARWDGASWSAVPGAPGVSGPITVTPDGRLAIGTPSGVTQWDGTTWTPLVGGSSLVTVNALTSLHGGDLVAGGLDVVRWSGSSWSSLAWPLAQEVDALFLRSNGALVAGTEGGQVGAWNGTSWSLLPALPHAITAFAELRNGDLVAGGPTQISRWDGTTWSSLGAVVSAFPAFPEPLTLHVLPNGDLMAGGWFHSIGGVAANGIARWNGSAWSPCDGGMHNSTLSGNGAAYAMAMDENGDLLVGGDFAAVGAGGATTSGSLARLGTSCQATVALYGSGCPSSGGANLLTAKTLPWVDATFTATAIGLPLHSFALTLTSLTPIAPGALPLTGVLPIGVPGCDVLVTPDILGVVVPTAGTVESSFFLPNTPPLVGVTFYHQLLPFEVDQLGRWIAITATNSLQLTAGMF